MSASEGFGTLAPDQQKLLLAALESQSRKQAAARAANRNSNPPQSNLVNPSLLTKDSQDDYANASFDNSYSYDYAEIDNNFDLNISPNGLDLTNGFPTFPEASGEKRKSMENDEDDEDDDSDDNKRRDNDDKSPKKPGRKPLTSEPTTKRKAQNRAAQRAFRDRKEKHLKDLEIKVNSLEKISDATSEENGLLRAQVQKLQSELKDYRKRMSLSAGSISTTTPLHLDSANRDRKSSSLESVDFGFDFSRFGAMPGANLGNFSSAQYQQEPASQRQNSSSSRSNGTSMLSNTSSNPNRIFGAFGDDAEFGFPTTTSPSPLEHVQLNPSVPRLSPYNSGSSASPASSASLRGTISSSCTSPDTIENWPAPPSASKANSLNGFTDHTPGLTFAKTPSSELANFDWFTAQDTQFDPILFGDYRESQDAVIGDGGFSSGFFDDSLAVPDLDTFNFMTPTNTTTQSAPKQNLMQQVERQRDGEASDYAPVTSADESAGKSAEKGSMMTANKIWYVLSPSTTVDGADARRNTLQACPLFKSGDFDIDTLCAELSHKATCSETGLEVPQKDVQAVLWRLAGKPQGPSPPGMPL